MAFVAGPEVKVPEPSRRIPETDMWVSLIWVPNQKVFCESPPASRGRPAELLVRYLLLRPHLAGLISMTALPFDLGTPMGRQDAR